MDDPLRQIEPVIDRAKLLRGQGQFDASLRFIQQAIDQLQSTVQSLDQTTQAPVDARIGQRNRVACHLADCHGIKGGILRRQGLLEEARRSYEVGAAIEQNPAFGIVNSYNLTNALVLSLLIDPQFVETEADRFVRARETVANQVENDPKRRKQWWAWADLGLLSLLSGDARHVPWAYANFKANGARASDFDSTLAVLMQCRDRLQATQPALAGSLDEAITSLQSQRPSE